MNYSKASMALHNLSFILNYRNDFFVELPSSILVVLISESDAVTCRFINNHLDGTHKRLVWASTQVYGDSRRRQLRLSCRHHAQAPLRPASTPSITQTAINSRFHQAHPHSPPNPADDQEIVRKYIEFTRKKNEEWSLFAVLLNLIWSILVSLFNVLIALSTFYLMQSLPLCVFVTWEVVLKNCTRANWNRDTLIDVCRTSYVRQRI